MQSENHPFIYVAAAFTLCIAYPYPSVFNAATIWSSSQAVKAWDFDSLIVGSIPACSAKIAQKGGVDVYKIIVNLWSYVPVIFTVCERIQYPPMIGSWYDGYISEIPFYTSGFL